MARIRSIKPDFWSDGKIRRLSDHAALFFIGLWNFCDDAGYFSLDSLELSMKLPRWRSQDIPKMLSALVEAGLVRCSRGVGVGLVEGWSHQRIEKPRTSKWKDKEIQWDNVDDSRSVPGSFPARIGEDRIGEDPLRERGKKRTPSAAPAAQGAQVFIGQYVKAYQGRYGQGTRPTLGGKVQGQIKRFLADTPLERAVNLIEGYLRMDEKWFLTKCHDFSTFIENLNGISLFVDTGKNSTTGRPGAINTKPMTTEDLKAVYGDLIK